MRGMEIVCTTFDCADAVAVAGSGTPRSVGVVPSSAASKPDR